MKVYAYIVNYKDHNGFWDISRMICSQTIPNCKNYREFNLKKDEELFYDGEKIKVIKKLHWGP